MTRHTPESSDSEAAGGTRSHGANVFLGSLLLAGLVAGEGLPDRSDRQGLDAIAEHANSSLRQIGSEATLTADDVIAAANALQPFAENLQALRM